MSSVIIKVLYVFKDLFIQLVNYLPYAGSDGYDISHMKVANDTECIQKCFVEPDCVVAAYYNQSYLNREANTCYLQKGFQYENQFKHPGSIIHNIRCKISH